MCSKWANKVWRNIHWQVHLQVQGNAVLQHGASQAQNRQYSYSKKKTKTVGPGQCTN